MAEEWERMWELWESRLIWISHLSKCQFFPQFEFLRRRCKAFSFISVHIKLLCYATSNSASVWLSLWIIGLWIAGGGGEEEDFLFEVKNYAQTGNKLGHLKLHILRQAAFLVVWNNCAHLQSYKITSSIVI